MALPLARPEPSELTLRVLSAAVILPLTIAAIWFGDWRLGAVIGSAMVLNLITAGFAGAAIPLFLRRINVDPALAGGVVLTTVTDVVGFFSFLGLASIFLLG